MNNISNALKRALCRECKRLCKKRRKLTNKRLCKKIICIEILCPCKVQRKRLKRKRTRRKSSVQNKLSRKTVNRNRNPKKRTPKRIKRTSFTLRPNVRRFFHILPKELKLTETKIISAEQFIDDQGNPASHFPLFKQKGYYNLFINGVMQEGGLYQVNRDAIHIKETNQTILANTTMIVECVSFKVVKRKK